jgi:hypothetical protein
MVVLSLSALVEVVPVLVGAFAFPRATQLVRMRCTVETRSFLQAVLLILELEALQTLLEGRE